MQSQRVFVLAQERNPQTGGISARTGYGADLAMASSPLWEGEPTHLREVLWSQASCPAGTALHVTRMESGLAPSGTVCMSQSHLTVVTVGDTVGILEALAKAQPVPRGVLAEAAPQSAETRQLSLAWLGLRPWACPKSGTARPWEWGDQVNAGTEHQAFLSAMQGSGVMPVSPGRIGVALLANWVGQDTSWVGATQVLPRPQQAFLQWGRGQVGSARPWSPLPPPCWAGAKQYRELEVSQGRLCPSRAPHDQHPTKCRPQEPSCPILTDGSAVSSMECGR